jgi:hypothetical protein
MSDAKRDHDELERAGAGHHDGPASTSPYPLSRLAPTFDLVDVAREIQKADASLGNVTVAKLRTIAEQIRALQAQAAAVLDDAKRASELHHAKCRFQKRPGHVYHLYRKPDGSRYFSMLSPDDWGDAPDAFEGSYRLEVDMTWTPLEEASKRDEIEAPLRKLLGGG